jgi:hypothetical protein
VTEPLSAHFRENKGVALMPRDVDPLLTLLLLIHIRIVLDIFWIRHSSTFYME